MKYAAMLEKLLAPYEPEPTKEGYMLRCIMPDHKDRTPSFAVNAETGLWRCYGCKARGNIVHLVMQLRGLDFQAAQRVVSSDDDEHRDDFPTLDEDRVASSRNVDPPMDERVLVPYVGLCPRYLLDRGFARTTLRRFEIGYDVEAHRAVYPIRAMDGSLIGITRRATLPGQEPKYKHTTFSSGSHLYLGYHCRKRLEEHEDLATGVLFIVEGHLDAVRLWQEFVFRRTSFRWHTKTAFEPTNVIGACALFGSNMTEDQALLAVRHFPKARKVLAFDNDEAGEKALEIASEALLGKGERVLYRLHFPRKDPGDLQPHDRLRIEEME